jgi:hypothetical protein
VVWRYKEAMVRYRRTFSEMAFPFMRSHCLLLVSGTMTRDDFRSLASQTERADGF